MATAENPAWELLWQAAEGLLQFAVEERRKTKLKSAKLVPSLYELILEIVYSNPQ